jgi:hypothetical protein
MLLFFTIALILVLAANSLSPEECLEFGYNSQVLVCTTCDTIAQIVPSTAENSIDTTSLLYTNCKQCCIENKLSEDRKYQLAVLEMDQRYASFYPELEELIKDKKKIGLTVKYKFGVSPILLVYTNKADTHPADEISVSGWSKETFKDYLSTHVMQKKKKE